MPGSSKTKAPAKKRQADLSLEDDDAKGKRNRVSSLEASFEPEDFTMHDNSEVNIIVGRGKRLEEFPSVVASMEKHTTEDVLFAHKFLFGNKGSSLKKKELLENLGEFSGYLKKATKGYDQDKLEKEDEREEVGHELSVYLAGACVPGSESVWLQFLTLILLRKSQEKYSKKAFKMILAQVRMLCDFFDVIRVDEGGNPLNKDDMIENLLDFLSQPHKDFLNVEYPDLVVSKKAVVAPKKKKASPKKVVVKKVSAPAKPQPPKDPFSLVRKHKSGAEPSDEALRQWVKAYIVCFDMNSATTKHAIQTASGKFGVDLSGKKNTIKEMLADEM
jgi:adenylate cyclase class IV